ncbi:hypothetical protein [Fusibacter ferrireducens]|uniref:DUF4825 domain-containing protein n=1 Tax=Fusibacter ferrireducens TaxID=2785058 RepID=A0ABR9ZQA9_9FIRM|nr:hypothetical protein [Fusibacter ferrireducens]MBF4692650.1 hypothetical protein [Fusibacter ferrireducens]
MTKERWQKIFKTIIRSVTVVVVIIICLKVSQPSPASQSKSPTYKTGEGFGVSGMVDHANEVANAQVEASVAKYSEDINWEYGDPSLYYEDFSDIEKELDEKSNEMTEAFFKPKVDFPFYFKTKNQYYLPVLKEIRDGKLSVEEALDDPARTIRVLSSDIYYWVTDPNKQYFLNSDITMAYIKEQKALGIERYFHRFFSVIDESIDYEQINKSKNEEEPIQYLIDDNARIVMGVASDFAWSSLKMYDDNGLGAYLKGQYNQDFKPALFEYGFEESLGQYYYPVSDPSLQFAATDYGDLYLTVLAQRAMYEEIDKIIEEEGYGGQIAHVSIPRTIGLTFIQVEKGYDMSQKYDNRTIINEVYDGGYDTNLLLLLEEGEEVDYAKLQQISARIQDLFYTTIFDNQEIWQRSDLFIYFYTLPKVEHKIVIDLFDRDMITETFFRDKTKSIGDIYVNMYITRVETEGFHYLDVRAKKSDFLQRVLGSGQEIRRFTIDEFEKNCTSDTIFAN